ncbi:FAD-dependent oxidoreductase [Rhizobium sp. NPDC092014]|uniref:FAD-dependent oxidoreductase n=2 Tax=Rhizobium TaxID=379 RepID=UPI00380AC000
MKPMYVNANAPKVVVVGAGIVGASAAYFLAKQRIAVSLIDTAGPSAGATGSSDGAVSVASKQPGMMMTLAQKARAFYSQLASEGVLAGIYHPRPTFLISRTEEEMELLEVHAHDLRASGEETEIADSERLKRFVPGLSDAAIGGVVIGHVAIGVPRTLGRFYPVMLELSCRDRGVGVRRSGQAELTLSCELALLSGRPCDYPVCAASAYP